jgi:hypothetical protein
MKITLESPLPEAVEVDGTGAWSNTGKPRRYVADTIVVEVTAKSTQIYYRGATRAGRRVNVFFSDDPRLRLARGAAAYRAGQAWALLAGPR